MPARSLSVKEPHATIRIRWHGASYTSLFSISEKRYSVLGRQFYKSLGQRAHIVDEFIADVGTVRNDPLQRHGLLLVADDVDIGSAIRQFIRNAFVTDEVDHLAGLSCKGGQHGKYAGIL